MASLFDRILGRPAPPSPPLMPIGTRFPIKAVYGGPALTAYQNDVPLSMLNQSPEDKARAYLRAYKVGWFYKAESKISLDISNLKRTLSPEDSSGDNETAVLEADLSTPWERLSPELQFLRLMERPNPTQTGRQLFQKTQIRLDMAGWTYWYMENAGPIGSGSLPTAIYGISPSRMTPSFDKAGTLLGWVMDRNDRGGGVPFEPYEIVQFSQESADDMAYGGQGVVEAVLSELPLGDQYARHQSDLLATGGRLAGMLWPKDRTLDEDEFQDAQRAWRSVASDPNAARRLLLFPEPMEYSNGAADPKDIGIPELSMLNRDNILTAFPISPYMLGVPMPSGLSAGGEARREEKRTYHEDTLHPRVETLEETIQVNVVAMYEAVTGTSLDFDIVEPNLDDATSLIKKVAAFDAMTSAGFDAKDSIDLLGLDNIKWAPPAPPVVPVVNTTAQGMERISTPVPTQMPQMPAMPKAAKSAVTERDAVTEPATVRSKARLDRFFAEQKRRVTTKMRSTLPAAKADRMKAEPTWWDAEEEDRELMATMREIYADVGRGGLQAVADNLGRIIFKGATNAVIADLLTVGGERIKDINARTLQALTVELAEGTRRGYSIPQLIDGVPDEGYRGVGQAGLDNGVEVWSDNRAETIARTETMLSYNRATVTGYGEFGVSTLLAYDGDQDEECAARDGQEFSIDEALGIDDHPNGTLVWSPVVDKTWHEQQDMGWVVEMVKAALAERPAPAPVVVNLPENHGPAITIEPAAPFVDALDEVNDRLTELQRPKRIIRNEQGRITGVETT